MFCVIQEVEVKTVPAGEPKGVVVDETKITWDGEGYTKYSYHYASERFERPIRKSYRISIHESYRENGKVKKKQTVICTIGYYEVVDWGDWPGDSVVGGLASKADALGLEESELADLIYTKWQAIVDRIWEEYKQTEEYTARQENRRIIREHNERVNEFTEKYGVTRSEYNRCYDVFGKLRNPEYLKKIKAPYCGRRVRYLYDYYKHYACRKCAKLNYSCQQKSGMDEIRLKMERIAERLDYQWWRNDFDCIADVYYILNSAKNYNEANDFRLNLP